MWEDLKWIQTFYSKINFLLFYWKLDVNVYHKDILNCWFDFYVSLWDSSIFVFNNNSVLKCLYLYFYRLDLKYHSMYMW